MSYANVQSSAAAPPADTTDWSAIRLRLGPEYQLGRLMQEPVVSVLFLDAKLKELKDYPTDAAASQAIVDDAKIAATTRATEAKAYTDASKLIGDMNGPQSMQTECNQAVTTLTAPLVVSADTTLAGADPVTVRILATLDEAEHVKPDPSALLAWLRFTQGRDGLWAFHLGQFSVGLEDTMTLHEPNNNVTLYQRNLYEPELIPEVIKFMPDNAPAPIANALRTLRGMPQSDPKLPAAITDAREAIEAVFPPGK